MPKSDRSPAGRALFLSMLLTACASHPKHAEFARATPTSEPAPPAATLRPAPIVVGVASRSFAIAPQSKSTEPSVEEVGSPTYKVIDDANRAAAQGPQEATYFNAIQEYVFEPGQLFQIYTAPLRVTDIALQPDERIIGQPASGDVVRWVLAVGKSMDGSVEQQHLYLKPTRPGLHTNLVINTNRRSYFLEIHSYKDTYMASVKWRYPQDEVAKLAADAQSAQTVKNTTSPIVSMENLNFRYQIEVTDGEPKWTPTQVFDDGKKTFIRFPGAMLVREAPALFIMRDDETQIPNYRVKGDMYVVDRLFEAAELRVGQADQEIVRIEREED